MACECVCVFVCAKQNLKINNMPNSVWVCVHSAMHLKLDCYSQPALPSTLALSLALLRYASARPHNGGSLVPLDVL